VETMRCPPPDGCEDDESDPYWTVIEELEPENQPERSPEMRPPPPQSSVTVTVATVSIGPLFPCR
jgi:hypothetical protein